MTVITSEKESGEMMAIMRSTLLGEPLRSLNVSALGHLMSILNKINPQSIVAVPDTSLWLQRHITSATSRALFGEKTPLTDEHHHLIW